VELIRRGKGLSRRTVLRALCLMWVPVARAGEGPVKRPAASRALRIVIDPGHTPSRGGALGARGIYEVQYNDALAAQVCEALGAAGFTPILSRAPGQEMSLEERARMAAGQHADLFLSLHHDSAQLRYLEKITVGGRDAYRTTRPIRGYSLFVSQINPQFARSYRFAALLGDEMRQIGRTPSLHHTEAIPGENRELLDAKLGIYRFDDLVVLKKNDVPAVLLEVGVITDPVDDAYVSDKSNQARVVEAIVAAVRSYADEFPGSS
jgi:N-acetylmuramoyl-L-alanine amidase